MSDTKEKLIEQAGGVLEKAYDDIAHPTAKSVGNTLSLVPRTVGVWLSKWEKWVINGEESIKLTAQAVHDKAAQIPEEKLSEPEAYVAVPAIQQLSYCYDSEELREMYANLLVSSMNIDTKYNVHPSFVDIIKQLTPDEAKFLKHISKGNSYPLLGVNIKFSSGGHKSVVKNFTNIAYGVCDCPESVFSYLDNLERLKLINIHSDEWFTNELVYKSLEDHSYIQAIIYSLVENGQKYDFSKGLFELTSFGRGFIKVCF